jgi:RND family efflux transporter MFP subunit
MKPAFRRAALPVGLLVLGLAGMMVLLAGRPAGRRQAPPDTRRLVRTVVATPSDVPLVVRSEGTVTARTESDLVAEVAGRVVFVSPALRPGGFFATGDVLLRIEPRDYQVGLKRAQAAVERSQGELELAEQNLARQEGLRSRDAASRSAYDEAASRARVSRAARLDAEAALEQAELDLERTELRAPFAGRVLEKYIDLGQFAGRGTRVARTYAIDTAEVRLPLSDEDLAYLDIPLASRAGAGVIDGPEVLLRARFAGSEHEWQGRIVRTEGRIDPAPAR